MYLKSLVVESSHNMKYCVLAFAFWIMLLADDQDIEENKATMYKCINFTVPCPTIPSWFGLYYHYLRTPSFPRNYFWEQLSKPDKSHRAVCILICDPYTNLITIPNYDSVKKN